MIKISKTAKPQVLIKNAPTWTKEHCDCLKAGKKPSKEIKYRYNHPQIKQALEKETHGKCAYCESKIKQVAYGGVFLIHTPSFDFLFFDYWIISSYCDKDGVLFF